ncbi:MAG: autotransporter-associated beta strand repeat-containing protein, partial [Ilumatobacteraceae bacterium]
MSISGGITLGEPITIAGSGYGSVGAIRNTSGTNTVSAQLTLSGATEFQSDAGELIVDVASGSGISGTNTNLTFDGSGNFSILDPIATGSGTLTKSGTGTLYLPAVNTFTGSTTISAGTVSINADSGLGVPPGSPTAGHLIFNGGTLRTNATFTLNVNRGIRVDSGNGYL